MNETRGPVTPEEVALFKAGVAGMAVVMLGWFALMGVCMWCIWFLWNLK